MNYFKGREGKGRRSGLLFTLIGVQALVANACYYGFFKRPQASLTLHTLHAASSIFTFHSPRQSLPSSRALAQCLIAAGDRCRPRSYWLLRNEWKWWSWAWSRQRSRNHTLLQKKIELITTWLLPRCSLLPFFSASVFPGNQWRNYSERIAVFTSSVTIVSTPRLLNFISWSHPNAARHHLGREKINRN